MRSAGTCVPMGRRGAFHVWFMARQPDYHRPWAASPRFGTTSCRRFPSRSGGRLTELGRRLAADDGATTASGAGDQVRRRTLTRRPTRRRRGGEVPDAVRPAARVAAIKNSLAPLRSYLDVWDELRRQPGVCDFVLGNPQEMPLPGFVDAIRRHAESTGQGLVCLQALGARSPRRGGQGIARMARTAV